MDDPMELTSWKPPVSDWFARYLDCRQQWIGETNATCDVSAGLGQRTPIEIMEGNLESFLDKWPTPDGHPDNVEMERASISAAARVLVKIAQDLRDGGPGHPSFVATLPDAIGLALGTWASATFLDQVHTEVSAAISDFYTGLVDMMLDLARRIDQTGANMGSADEDVAGKMPRNLDQATPVAE